MHAFEEFPSVLNLTNRQQFFHGLFFIDRKTYRQGVQNSSEAWSRGREFSLQGFEHFDVIFMENNTAQRR